MTEELVRKLWEQYRVPSHVRAHMEKVAAVAIFLGEKLVRAGEKIDLEKLRQGALLHDLMKLCDFKELDLTYFNQIVTAEDIQFWTALIKSCSKVGHVQAAYDVLMDLGEQELALMVKKHRFGSLVDPQDKPVTWEEKLLYYADKRVKHDQVVSVAERLKDGQERYFPDGNVPATDALVKKALDQLEKEILEPIGLKPEDINEQALPKAFL